MRVRDYQTGATLAGVPSAELVTESLAAEPTGTVRAYLDAGVWHPCREGGRIVWVE